MTSRSFGFEWSIVLRRAMKGKECHVENGSDDDDDGDMGMLSLE